MGTSVGGFGPPILVSAAELSFQSSSYLANLENTPPPKYVHRQGISDSAGNGADCPRTFKVGGSELQAARQ